MKETSIILKLAIALMLFVGLLASKALSFERTK